MDKLSEPIFKDIHNVINNIKKCKSKSTYTILCNELNTLYNLCYELDIDDFPKLEDYSSKSIPYKEDGLTYAYKVINNYDYHLKFSNNYKKIDGKKYMYPNSFVIHDFFDSRKYFYIIDDFFNKYDPSLTKIFNDMINEGRIYKVVGEQSKDEDLYTPAYTTCSYGSFKPYVVIKIENATPDLINLVHEMGHVKEFLNADSISKKVLCEREYNCFSEVYSHFLQNLFIRYLKEINFHPDDVNTSSLGYNYTFYHWIKKLNECLKNKRFDNSIIDYLNYTYGIALSYHFIDRYLKDPEKTKKDIDDFVIFNGQLQFMELLEKYHFKDEIINSKILKKYI